MNSFWWYLTRASGVVAWLLLTASVLWGIALSARPRRGRRPGRPWTLGMHKWLGVLTMSFLALHLLALLANSHVEFDPVDIVVPFTSSWRPWAVAFGVVAMWALVAVEVSSRFMGRIGRRTWRAIHLSSYLAFWATSLHATLAGTDAANPLYVVTALLSLGAVLAAGAYRLIRAADAADAADAASLPTPVAADAADAASLPTPAAPATDATANADPLLGGVGSDRASV